MIPLTLQRTKGICQSHHTPFSKRKRKKEKGERKNLKERTLLWFSLSITKKKYPLKQYHHFFLPSKLLKSFYKSCIRCSLWWGPPNWTGNQNQTHTHRERERERETEEREREVGKQQGRKNQTIHFSSFLFFWDPNWNYVCFHCFCCITEILFTSFKSKKRGKNVKLHLSPLNFY